MIPVCPRSEWSNWLTPWRFAAVLGLVLLPFFYDVILGLRTFFHHDYAVFGYPLAYFHRESFWRGEIPLWNPYNNFGQPFLAQWNTLTLYPGSLLYLLLPLTWGLGLFCLGHLFLGGMGMYFLAHRWTGNRLAAGVAGVVLAYNGLSQSCLSWPNNVAALGLMPWVLFTVDRALDKGRRHVGIAALVGGVQMLAGAPELILFTWLIGGCLFVEKFLRERKVVLIGRFVTVVFLVAAVAAAQLLPFLELLRHSQRGVGYADTFYSMPIGGWLNLVVPLFGCYSSRYGVYFQLDQHWTSSYYLGIATVVLCAVALWKGRTPRVWWLAGLAITGLLLALGNEGYVYRGFRAAFPQLSFMNFPVKFVVLTVFCVPALAAFGTAKLIELLETCTSDARRVILAICIPVLVAAVSAVAIDALVRHPGVEWKTTLLNAVSRVALLALIIGAFVLLPRVTEYRKYVLLNLAAVLFMAADLLTYGPNPNPTIDPGFLQPNLEHKDLQPLPRHGEARVWVDPFTHDSVARTRMKDPGAHLLILRLMLHLDLNLLDSIPKGNGFFSLYIRESDEFKAVADSHWPTNAPGLFDFISASHVPSRTKDLEWESRPGFLPMVTAGQKPIFANAEETLKAIAAPKFNPREVVYLENEASDAFSITNSTSAKIVAARFEPQKIEIDVDAGQPSIVTLSQSFYPPWRAYVDDRPTRLWKANHAFQALQVPQGQHKVRVVYEDRTFRTGVIVSLAAIALCLGLIASQRKARVH